MFYLILIAAITVLTVGFIAALVHHPLDGFAGPDATATIWVKKTLHFCRCAGIWAGGFMAALFALAWLKCQSLWLYGAASLVIGTSVIAYCATLAITGLGIIFFWKDMIQRRSQDFCVAAALVLLVGGVFGIYHSLSLFFVPVYSAIA
ncbi:hypothetical protein [Sphingopyxis yananensis]|uniref:hypothetical protein n=1 Tax=Sphingopyxis yananensis TaxID=2886687 RepID=UPI001D127A82|nr:hypothetical protein [Sphingopyxis yananensis]MCC2603010.1 hypothetical protein [Sphingopyxis yananensis]